MSVIQSQEDVPGPDGAAVPQISLEQDEKPASWELIGAGRICRDAHAVAAWAGNWAEPLRFRPVRTLSNRQSDIHSLQWNTAMSLTVVKNATCTFCGCVCDDIELHADETRITHTKNACILGQSWFLNHTVERLYPDALIDGKPANVEAAIEKAADYLHQAHMPLVYGLSNITCEAQREAAYLGELIGGVLDSHTSL